LYYIIISLFLNIRWLFSCWSLPFRWCLPLLWDLVIPSRSRTKIVLVSCSTPTRAVSCRLFHCIDLINLIYNVVLFSYSSYLTEPCNGSALSFLLKSSTCTKSPYTFCVRFMLFGGGSYCSKFFLG
jgi:hypothetical protein